MASETEKICTRCNTEQPLDGSEDYVNCGSGSSLDTTAGFSMSLWFKADTLGSKGKTENVLFVRFPT